MILKAPWPQLGRRQGEGGFLTLAAKHKLLDRVTEPSGQVYHAIRDSRARPPVRGEPVRRAALAGIGRQTVYDWLAKGKRQRQGHFADFCEAVKRATAIGEVRLVNIPAPLR
jgi:hypothetical protein